MAKYKMAAYVKLAKLWERARDKVIEKNNEFMRQKRKRKLRNIKSHISI